MNTNVNVFEEFRQDHRQVRDSLLEIAGYLESADIDKARGVLDRINKMVGPHFRFEEEDLYPALRIFLGEYVDQLLGEHDGAIGAAKVLVTLLGKDTITPEEGKEAAKAARALLVHVSNCDGLAILGERLPAQELTRLGAALATSREAGVTLLDWAETIRK
ncbi:MAG: hemerythrin domain-containing protein [Dehalococcoidia bacterium]|nr:hemerythrin domain-containing protein [Dehalococcoidia bacterium]